MRLRSSSASPSSKRQRAPHAAFGDRRSGSRCRHHRASSESRRRRRAPRRRPAAAATPAAGSASGWSAGRARREWLTSSSSARRGGSSRTLSSALAPSRVEFVDRIDDGDPPSPLPGRRAEEGDRSAHVVDVDVLAQLVGLLVDGALEHQQIALRLRRDAPRHRMIGIDVQRCRAPAPTARPDRDGRARSAPSDRRASPCRCRPGRRSARRAGRRPPR